MKQILFRTIRFPVLIDVCLLLFSMHRAYQVTTGIHGMPFEAWDEVVGDNDLGYCTHNSILFGPWHRVYLALFEQVITSLAQEIAATYPTELRITYEAAAKGLRVPYWDWANSSIMPTVVTIPQIDIQGPSGIQTIRNPLYSYTFESSTNFPSRFLVSLSLFHHNSPITHQGGNTIVITLHGHFSRS